MGAQELGEEVGSVRAEGAEPERADGNQNLHHPGLFFLFCFCFNRL